jgi:GTPase
VHDVLDEIGGERAPEQLVLNKIDQADPASLDALVRRVQVELGAEPVLVSAVTGEGVEDLVERIVRRLPQERVRVSAHVPYARQDLVALAHRRGEVLKEAHTDTGTDLIAEVEVAAALELRDYLDVDPFADEPEAWELDAVRDASP